LPTLATLVKRSQHRITSENTISGTSSMRIASPRSGPRAVGGAFAASSEIQ
jgi:hypothetical protein